MATLTPQVQPTFKNAAEERFYRHSNPNSDYTKQVDMKYIQNIGNALKNNTGVSQAQLNDYNARVQKWNVSTTPSMDSQIGDMFNNQSKYLNDMYNQQKESQLGQLRASRDKAIGEINQQKANVAPQYQTMRNQTDATNLQNVQRLREVMANAGLTSSGENVTANVAMNNQRVNSLNQLNLQEQQAVNDYDRRIADLNNPAEENALIAAIEAERSRAMYDAYNLSQETGYNRYRDGVEDQRYNDQFSYQKERDARTDAEWESEQKYQRQWNKDQFDYQKYRDAISDQQNTEALNFEKSKFASETAWRSYVYNNMSATEKAQLEWNKQQFGEDMAWQIESSNRADKLARDQMSYDAGFQEP